MSYEPIRDRVIIQPDPMEKKTPGGIVLPDKAADRPQQGTVVSIGPGPLLEDGGYGPMQCEEEDRVLFSPYADRVKIGEDEFILCKESDLLAILHDDETTERKDG
jgi:chaperonin GroES